MYRIVSIIAAVLIAPGAALGQEQSQLARAAAFAPELGEVPESLVHLPSTQTVLDRARESAPELAVAQALVELIESWHEESERVALSALVGLMTDDERELARYASASVLHLAGGAENYIPTLIERADRAPGANRVASADLLHQLQVVAPLRAVRALVLLASIEEDGLRARRLAQAALALVEAVDPFSPWSRAERARLTGQALRRAGNPKDALEVFGRAETLAVEDLPAPYRDLVAIETGVGRVLATLEAGDPDAARRLLAQVIDSAALIERHWSDPDLLLHRADVLMRIALVEADDAATEGDQYRALSRGLLGYEQLRIQTDGRDDGPHIREMIYTRLGGVVEEDWDFERLPVMALVALAAREARLPANEADASLAHVSQELRNRLESAQILPEPLVRDIEWTLAGGFNGFPIFDRRWVPIRVHRYLIRDSWESLVAFAQRFPSDDRAKEAFERAYMLVHADMDFARFSRSGSLTKYVRFLPFYYAADSSPLQFEQKDELRIEAGKLALGYGTEAPTIQRALACVLRVSRPSLMPDRRAVESRLLLKLVGQGVEGAKASFADSMHDRIERGEVRAAIQQSDLASDIEREHLIALAQMEREAGRSKRAIAVLDEMPNSRALTERGWKKGLRFLESKLAILIELGEVDRAIALLEFLKADDRWVRSRSTRSAELMERVWQTIEKQMPRFFDEPSQVFENHEAQLLERVYEMFEDALSDDLSRRLAWIKLMRGDAQGASAIFKKLRSRDMRGLGEAHLLLSDDTSAFANFKLLADQSPAGSRDYFHAWVRMLEILERQNADGSRTSRITRELRRLQALPDVSNYQDCAQRLRAIENRINQ